MSGIASSQQLWDVCHPQVNKQLVALGYFNTHICISVLKAIHRDRSKIFPKQHYHKLNFQGHDSPKFE